MWFKNLILYRFSKPFDISPEKLEKQLAERPFRAVGGTEPSYTGWYAPLGKEGQQLVHTTGQCMMLCARTEEKILPAAAVKELVEARAEEIEEKQGRKLRRKEKQELKEEVLLDMMPRAFSKCRNQYAYIDRQNGWLMVDAASASRAEALISLLRETLGGFPVAPMQVEQEPSAVMTGWLQRQQAPGAWVIGEECELREPGEDGGIARIRKQDLTGDEIRVHLEAGKRVNQLALCHDERVCLLLDAGLQLKRIRFLDAVLEEADNGEESAAARFDADFALMSLEFSRLLPQLLELFGGATDVTAQRKAA